MYGRRSLKIISETNNNILMRRNRFRRIILYKYKIFIYTQVIMKKIWQYIIIKNCIAKMIDILYTKI